MASALHTPSGFLDKYEEDREDDSATIHRELVTAVTPNARVIAIDETNRDYRVTIAGTTGVTATCELSREEIAAAERWREARRNVAAALKGAADRTVATIPDARA